MKIFPGFQSIKEIGSDSRMVANIVCCSLCVVQEREEELRDEIRKKRERERVRWEREYGNESDSPLWYQHRSHSGSPNCGH